MNRYFFPEHGVTIEAETLADATALLESQSEKPDALQSKRKKRS